MTRPCTLTQSKTIQDHTRQDSTSQYDTRAHKTIKYHSRQDTKILYKTRQDKTTLDNLAPQNKITQHKADKKRQEYTRHYDTG